MEPKVLRILADEFIKLSSSEKDSDLEEGFLRTSVEKSYYYVFSVLKQAELNLNMHVSDKSDAHRDVSENLEQLMTRPKGLKYSRMLISLRNQRNNATYELAKVMGKTDADSMLLEASKFLDKLKDEGVIGIQIDQLL